MKNMIIPFNQKHFGLCFRKKSLQNYERFGSQPHYPAPVKFALAHCKLKQYLELFSILVIKDFVIIDRSLQ